MVKEIRIYFEGDTALRPGFSAFFIQLREAGAKRGVKVQPVAGGGSVVRDFMKGLRTHPDALNILLKDSEGPDDEAASTRTSGDCLEG